MPTRIDFLLIYVFNRFTPGFCHNFHHLNADLAARQKLENGRTKADPDQQNLVDVIHNLHHLFQKLCSSDGYTGDPKVSFTCFRFVLYPAYFLSPSLLYQFVCFLFHKLTLKVAVGQVLTYLCAITKHA